MTVLITADSIANEVRLRRTQARGVFVICEGDDDMRFYGRMLDPTCEFVFARGFENVLGSLEILNADDRGDVVGIIDSDFGGRNAVDNLVETGVHDLECILIGSPALAKVVNELGSEAKLRSVASHDDLLESLLLPARPVGVLRRISLRDDLRLDFNGLRFRAFLDRASLETDVRKLVKEVCDNSSNHLVDRDWLVEETNLALHETRGSWFDVAGPDVIEVLSVALTSKFGSRRQSAVEPEMIERALHLAYEHNWFSQTVVSLKLAEWEERHPGATVRQRGFG